MKNIKSSTGYTSAFAILLMLVAIWAPGVLHAQNAQGTLQAGLATEIAAAANDTTALQAIIAREQAQGNTDALALALANAAESLVNADADAASSLMTQAVGIAENASPAVQDSVGVSSSLVASTATSIGNAGAASATTTSVAMSSSSRVAVAFVNAGGSAGGIITYTGQNSQGQTVTVAIPVTSQNQIQQVPGQRPRVVPDQRIQNPQEPEIPATVEPNPVQSGSPV